MINDDLHDGVTKNKVVAGDSLAVQALLDGVQQLGDLRSQVGVGDGAPLGRVTAHQHHLLGFDVARTQLQPQRHTLDTQPQQH